MEGRGGNIFNEMCLVQFLGGEVRGEEGSKIPHILNFCFPPNWGDLEGRGGKICYCNINYIDIFILIFILKYQNYPYLFFFYIANLLIFL
jgi:hypothetical protein